MPRSSSSAVVLVSALLLPLGLCVLAGGILGALDFPETWWAFALLGVGGGGLIIYTAVRNVLHWAKATAVDDATRGAMLASAQAGPGVAAATGAVLAHWTYQPAEWRRYSVAELRFRACEALLLGATSFVIVALIGRIIEPDWRVLAAMAGWVAGFLTLVRLLYSFAEYRRNAAVAYGEVILGPAAMLVNGRFETIEDDAIHFESARVLESVRPAILEIVIMVPSKDRHRREDYRIPIPPGKEDEARAVAAALERAHRPALAKTEAGAALPGG